jgi:hypothetical protein
MCSIATCEGAYVGIIGPASSAATSSTFGMKVLVVTATRPQKTMIGIARRRTVLAKNGRPARWALTRISLGR